MVVVEPHLLSAAGPRLATLTAAAGGLLLGCAAAAT